MTYSFPCGQSLPRLGVALLFIFLSAAPAASGTPVGMITEVHGLATVNGQDARAGMTLGPEDMIRTGARGKVRVVFPDQQIVEILENSCLLIKDGLPSSQEKSRFNAIRVVYDKLAGWVRDMAGWFKEESQTTETAVIGVRGIVPQKEDTEITAGDSSKGPVPPSQTSGRGAPGFGNRIAPPPCPRSQTPLRNHEWNGTRGWITG